jgi:drug/metabolite transporter (DMT)-like permease
MIEKIMTKKGSVALLAMFCCALWGISTPIVKMGYNHIDETHIPSLLLWVGTQFIVAGLIAIGIQSIFSKKVALPKKESLKGIAIVSVLQTVLQYSLMYIGLSQTSSVKGAILKSTDVFVIVLIASLIFKLEKLTVKKLVSCIIGFLGIIIMNLDGLSFQISPIGDGLVLLSVISYSFSVIMIKFFAEKEQPIILCGYQMSLGGIVLMVLGLLLGGKFDFAGMLPVFICLSLIYSVSYVLWTVLLKYNPASSVSIYSFMTPVFGVIFSSLLLSEDGGVATLSLIIALVLVCAGIILWGYEKKSNSAA